MRAARESTLTNARAHTYAYSKDQVGTLDSSAADAGVDDRMEQGIVASMEKKQRSRVRRSRIWQLAFAMQAIKDQGARATDRTCIVAKDECLPVPRRKRAWVRVRPVDSVCLATVKVHLYIHTYSDEL